MKKLFFLSALLLSACGAANSVQDNFSHLDQSKIARPAFLVERKITVGDDEILIWERMHKRHAPARLYVGGTGDFGLKLATHDKSANVAWVPAINNARLNQMKSLYDLNGFDVILINQVSPAAKDWLLKREDILSLRTVAATLPILNDDAPALADIPQVHFTGAMDETETPAHYHAFRQAMGQSDCVKYALITDADETEGWINIWPKLLKIKPECKQNLPAEPVKIDTTPLPPIRLYEK